MLTLGNADRGVNTFSPEGRLFQGEPPSRSSSQACLTNTWLQKQVEYAIEAIKVCIQQFVLLQARHTLMLLHLSLKARFHHCRRADPRRRHFGRREAHTECPARVFVYREDYGDRQPCLLCHVWSDCRRANHGGPCPCDFSSEFSGIAQICVKASI